MTTQMTQAKTQKTTKQKILEALQKNPLTKTQISSRFKIVNVSARISELRKAGYNIECVSKQTKKGSVTNYYTLSPTA